MNEPDDLPPMGVAPVEDLSVLPVAQAARSLAQCIRPFDQNITLDEVAWSLRSGLAIRGTDWEDEEILYGHARVLDSMFHRLVVKGLQKVTYYNSKPPEIDDAYTYIDDARIDLALRAPNQCRMALAGLTWRGDTPSSPKPGSKK